MRPAHNYLWCLVPGKGILKGSGKKESFYHVLKKTLGSNLPVFSFSPRCPVIAVFPSTLGAFNLKGGF